MWYFKDSVRPYKVGPDFIDIQFHKKISTNSINLDSFMQTQNQVKWTFYNYAKDINIIEGVMGFYDGDDKGCSTNSITNLLNIPTILILDASGTYITISAVLKGILEYKKNTIKAIVLNKISSKNHFLLIKKILEKEHNLPVIGYIEKDLESLNSIHLGLDLKDLSIIEKISKDVLKYIDISLLLQLTKTKQQNIKYPFTKIKKQNKTLAIVYDENFSFLYYDNLQYFKEIYDVVLVSSTKDENFEADIVFIPGGYVETSEAYNKIKNSNNFKNSLIKHSKTKPIYAECAGLIYLGKKIDNKQMSEILDIEFSLEKRFQRLGYYQDEFNNYGHAFHYSKPTNLNNWFNKLTKNNIGSFGSYQKELIFGTYLHQLFRGKNLLYYLKGI